MDNQAQRRILEEHYDVDKFNHNSDMLDYLMANMFTGSCTQIFSKSQSGLFTAFTVPRSTINQYKLIFIEYTSVFQKTTNGIQNTYGGSAMFPAGRLNYNTTVRFFTVGDINYTDASTDDESMYMMIAISGDTWTITRDETDALMRAGVNSINIYGVK